MTAMPCLSVIHSARDVMSANEKKLADFVLENAPLIRDYSSQQIARAVGVSQSSVVKFSQKLGYKGFTDLKLAVHESVVIQETSESATHNNADVFDEEQPIKDWLCTRKREALNNVSQINNNDTVLAAVRAIEVASRVQIVGTGSAGLVAKDMSYKLIELGKAVVAESDREVQLLGIDALQQNDCLVVISRSGQATHLVDAAKLARKAGAVVVSITNQWANPLGAISDIRLYSFSNGDSPHITNLIVAASQQHLVDLIYCTLRQRASRGKKPTMLDERKSVSGQQ